MSEPLSSVEIEDVLSSIRRLVSEDLRPASRNGAPAGGEAGKLILTPSLRVVENPAPVSERAADRGWDHAVPAEDLAEIGAEPEPEPEVEFISVRHAAGAVAGEPAAAEVAETIATLEQAVGARAEEWESETGDPAPAVAEAWTMPDWDAGGLMDSGEPQLGEGRAEPLAAPAEAGFIEMAEEAEFLGTARGEEASWANGGAPAWAQDMAEEMLQEPSEAEYIAEVPPEAAEAGPAAVDADWLQAAEAEVIAAIEEPVAEELRQVEDEILAGAKPARAEDDDAGPGLFDAPPELTFDEEVLRDLVRDLIREELQGGLGERITRNVRKLVRAEIARAMATRDMD